MSINSSKGTFYFKGNDNISAEGTSIITEQQNDDLKDHLASVNNIIFDPYKLFNSGIYLAGYDIPSGMVKIESTTDSSDVETSITIIDVKSKERRSFSTKLSAFWIELKEDSCIYIYSTDSNVRFRFISLDDVEKITSKDKIVNGVYYIGYELESGLNKIFLENVKAGTDVMVALSDNPLKFNNFQNLNYTTWIDLPKDKFMCFYADGTNTSYLTPIDHVKKYHPLDLRTKGVFKVGTEIPFGYVKFALSKYTKDENFEFFISKDPFITKKRNTIFGNNSWLDLPKDSYLHILSDSTNKFMLIDEKNVNTCVSEITYHKGIYRAGVELPVGYVNIKMSKTGRSPSFSLAVSKINDLFLNPKEYSGRTAWIKLEENDFLCIDCEDYLSEFEFFSESESGRIDDGRSDYLSGVRKASNELLAGFIKIKSVKKQCFRYSISKDPLNFTKYISSKNSSAWVQLEDNDFIDICGDEEDTYIFLSEKICSLEEECGAGVKKVGCEIPQGKVKIDIENGDDFSYSISNNPSKFSNFITVNDNSVDVDLKPGEFISLRSSNEQAKFSFSKI